MKNYFKGSENSGSNRLRIYGILDEIRPVRYRLYSL